MLQAKVKFISCELSQVALSINNLIYNINELSDSQK